MKKKLIFGVMLVCLLALGFVLSSCTKAEAQSRPERWEYTSNSNGLPSWNELGQQGWELVLMQGNVAILKRKLP